MFIRNSKINRDWRRHQGCGIFRFSKKKKKKRKFPFFLFFLFSKNGLFYHLLPILGPFQVLFSIIGCIRGYFIYLNNIKLSQTQKKSKKFNNFRYFSIGSDHISYQMAIFGSIEVIKITKLDHIIIKYMMTIVNIDHNIMDKTNKKAKKSIFMMIFFQNKKKEISFFFKKKEFFFFLFFATLSQMLCERLLFTL